MTTTGLKRFKFLLVLPTDHVVLPRVNFNVKIWAFFREIALSFWKLCLRQTFAPFKDSQKLGTTLCTFTQLDPLNPSQTPKLWRYVPMVGNSWCRQLTCMILLELLSRQLTCMILQEFYNVKRDRYRRPKPDDRIVTGRMNKKHETKNYFIYPSSWIQMLTGNVRVEFRDLERCLIEIERTR